MIQPINLCRQFTSYSINEAEPRLLAALRGNSMAPGQREEVLNYYGMMVFCRQQIARAVKFFLPNGGRFFDDLECRGIESDDEIMLPYPVVALEYLRDNYGDVDNEKPYTATKAIVLARQMTVSGMPAPPPGFTTLKIGIMAINWIVEMQTWSIFPEVGIVGLSEPINGRRKFTAGASPMASKMPIADVEDELGATLAFVNALACSNVSSRSIGAMALPAKRARHGALPFDEYHVLTVDVGGDRKNDGGQAAGGSHASPREHLRRGHIRRLSSGGRIWVNSCVVNPGIGGVVRKDYAVARATS